jgi:hypothetical protein
VRLRDVLFLSHARPVDEAQAALWKRLAENGLATPDTWEVALSAAGRADGEDKVADKRAVWERLLAERKLGALALLRNLRNLQNAGIDPDVIRKSLATVKAERVLPFRFISAAKHAPQLEPELEAAMFRCLGEVPRLKGKTVLAVDNSPSMYWAPVSAKSEIHRIDAACAIAMLLREICERVEVIAFSTTSTIVPPRRGFALRDAIKATESNGTHIGGAVERAAKAGYDRLIVITDEQSHDKVPAPSGEGYVINVASNRNGVGYGEWTHIDGWSEAVIDYIAALETAEGDSAA